MLDVRHIGIAVERPWRAVYEEIWRPERFPLWASGLSGADLRREGSVWVAAGPEGLIRITFTGHNAFGVMDHTVHLATGQQVEVPMRVIGHGEGAEVVLTLYRQPDMTDEVFARDVEWVGRDLASLKRLLEDGALGDKAHQAAHAASE